MHTYALTAGDLETRYATIVRGDFILECAAFVLSFIRNNDYCSIFSWTVVYFVVYDTWISK